ncbi:MULTISPECIES: sulfatase-like hydrolase/transferase [Salinibaculum]|uniref:sulfatase-like hydrolase/transferase n=1 Tax=Salinibaculum TaxID=2732368 RepID=UPI003609B364
MNIILVTIDCLRRDRCSVYGHHRGTTPALGALACDGFVFDRAYAADPATTESFPAYSPGRSLLSVSLGSTCTRRTSWMVPRRLVHTSATVAGQL